MIAARSGTAGENFKLLLRLTSDLNARNNAGKTALTIAREFGYKEVAELLVSNGAAD
jgi:ankyrin repeat protein